MYSVLIQNKKTLESFQEFHPLFLEVLKKDAACCRWLESGTTIDTALPELGSLTEDKEEWRAIIIRMEDGEGMQRFDTAPGNPYDFLVNREGADRTKESPVPLIHLTHMLGGVPAPELEYESRKVEEKNREPRIVYIPRRSIEKEMDYAALSRKYEFDGKLPCEILLLTLRRTDREPRGGSAKAAWENRMEGRSSEFWSRNNYPALCRFLVYDYVNEGAVQREADLFNFWMCALLLAVNNVDPSSLQAYRLYRIQAGLDRRKMSESFAYRTACLTGAENLIREQIRQDMEQKLIIHREKPEYAMSIPVRVDFPHTADIRVSQKEFPLCARSDRADRDRWNGLCAGAEYALDGTFRRAERALDESADQIRFAGRMSEEEVKPLDRFQERDMQEELYGTYERIIRTQGALPGARMEKRQRLSQLSGQVKQAMKSRLDMACAGQSLLLLAGLLLLSFLPTIFFAVRSSISESSIGRLAPFALFLLAGFAVTELLVLAVQKKAFSRQIEQYNEELENHVHDLTQNMALYTDFVSDMVSYSRGCSYLDILKKRNYAAENSYSALEQHLRAAASLLGRIARWGRACYLQMDGAEGAEERLVLDTEIPPQYNPMYTFETGKEYQVPLNESGERVISPFGFVRKLEIIREELYEDENE